jgi:hypothetical protein
MIPTLQGAICFQCLFFPEPFYYKNKCLILFKFIITVATTDTSLLKKKVSEFG